MKTNIKFPIWAEIDLKALEHNFNIVKKMVGKREIIPIIKANAYGHGIVQIAEFLTKKMNVNTFGVARVNEGILLRKNGIINSSIIILGGILKSEVDDVIEYDLEPAVFFISEIKYLGKKAREKNKTIGVHLKINTGMNRLGVKYPYHFYVLETIKEFAGKLPILGVCLGHQSIGQVFGGKIIRANKLMHGKTSNIIHDGKTIFKNMKNPFPATRYHSLVVEKETLPQCFEISAWTDDGEIMGIRHKEYKIEGVQFHPESILTKDGKKLLENFLSL